MAQEIERKFLVTSDEWRDQAGVGMRILQGYIVLGPPWEVRVRLKSGLGSLSVKGSRRGASRPEFDYMIPAPDAKELLRMCPQLIEKVRYELQHNGVKFEIDEFEGGNAGLILAEVELSREDQVLSLPSWVGEEVTDDARYYNASLARDPFPNFGG